MQAEIAQHLERVAEELMTVGMAAMQLIAVVMLATVLPARRATHVDPTIALREDG